MAAPPEASPEGSEVLQALLDPDDSIWQQAILDYDDDHSGPTIRSFKRDKILAGTSESGARVKAISKDFRRQEQREVVNRQDYIDRYGGLGTAGYDSYLEWQTTEHTKGLRLSVEREDSQGKRAVSMFLPDGLPAERTYQHPLEVTVENAFGSKTLGPDDEDFKAVEDEIRFYLGDNVVWDQREAAS